MTRNVLRIVRLLPVPLLLLSHLAAGPGTRPADATQPATAPAAWRPLFNGKDLDGWAPIGSAHWRVEDGVIVGTQDGDPKLAGLLTTKDSFQDFELELEF